MKKLAANYLIAEDGKFLKNGIVVAEDDGTATAFIDTTNDLKEIARLTFHNGILLANFIFRKGTNIVSSSESEQRLKQFIFETVLPLEAFSIQELVDLGKQVQEQFPEMKIPEILKHISEVLVANNNFVKENLPGIFLVIGVDLSGLHFTPKSRLKKIL